MSMIVGIIIFNTNVCPNNYYAKKSYEKFIRKQISSSRNPSRRISRPSLILMFEQKKLLELKFGDFIQVNKFFIRPFFLKLAKNIHHAPSPLISNGIDTHIHEFTYIYLNTQVSMFINIMILNAKLYIHKYFYIIPFDE